MNDRRPARDLSDRTLAAMVRLLPSYRAEWGLAMRAELASLDDAAVRRRYAVGCVWAVLRDHTAMRTVALHVVAMMFGAVALAFAISINGVGERIETIVFVSALGVLAWSGRRRGLLGPTVNHSSARRVRATGYVLLGAYILPALGSFAGASPQHDQGGVWMFYVAVTLYLATLLLVTAQRTAAPPRTLYLMAAVTVAGLAAWWVPMLLSSSVRAHPGWALLTVAGTVTLGMLVATALCRRSRQAAFAALSAGVAVSLLIFLAAQFTYIVNPSLVPNLGRVPGMTAAGEVEQNRTEAVDPYVAELLLGAVLGAVLIVATAVPRASARHERSAAEDPLVT
jgi:MFS family permease